MTSLTSDPTRTRRGTALVVLLALAVAVAGTVWFLGHRDRAALEGRTLDTTEAALADVADQLEGAVGAGEQVLASSAGQVEDEQVRADLEAALTDAAALETGPADTGSRSERSRVAEQRLDDATAQLATLATATGATANAFATWTLAQAVDADDEVRAALGTALADAAGVLAAGTGDAGDPAARAALTDAVGAATAAQDTPVDRADIDAVLASTTAVGSARAALETATRAVTG